MSYVLIRTRAHVPVQRIVGILAWLRREHDIDIATSTVLEGAGDVFGVCSMIVEQDRACTKPLSEHSRMTTTFAILLTWDMVEAAIF